MTSDEELTKLTIILVGETGVGKSTLTNAFLGSTINRRATVSAGASPTSQESIEEHIGNIDGVYVTIYDTKGFGDPKSDDTKLMKLFEEVIRKCKCNNEQYIIYICQRMLGRLNNSNEQFAKLLAKLCLHLAIFIIKPFLKPATKLMNIIIMYVHHLHHSLMNIMNERLLSLIY